MIIKPVFEIIEYVKDGENLLLNGYVLTNISITNRLIMYNKVDIKYLCENMVDSDYIHISDNADYIKISTDDMRYFGKSYPANRTYLHIKNDMEYIEISLESIYTYDSYVDELDMGISARLKCKCNFDQIGGYVLFAVLDNV
ncbi:MAG: hypothetical protein K2N90_06020 [Lachnospiraceae bacterium]|nr:hypothetical protein [Lachnospiraceae bacterium]